MKVYGIRAYEYGDGAYNVLADVYDYGDPLFKNAKSKPSADDQLKSLLNVKDKLKEVYALVAVTPNDVGLSQKTPLRMEVAVTGGKPEAQLSFVKDLLGKTISADRQRRAWQHAGRSRGLEGQGLRRPCHQDGNQTQAA